MWAPSMRISWAPCGLLPLLLSCTVTTPPLTEAGPANFEALPASEMPNANVVGAEEA